jgi:hypothetical protein
MTFQISFYAMYTLRSARCAARMNIICLAPVTISYRSISNRRMVRGAAQDDRAVSIGQRSALVPHVETVLRAMKDSGEFEHCASSWSRRRPQSRAGDR